MNHKALKRNPKEDCRNCVSWHEDANDSEFGTCRRWGTLVNDAYTCKQFKAKGAEP